MLKKIEYLYNDENIKIKNPTREEREEIRNKIDKHNKQNGDITNNTEELMYYLYKKLIMPKNEDYDFSLYTIDEFLEIIENPHEYKNMEEISNVIGILLQDIIIDKLQKLLMETKEQRMKILNLDLLVEAEKLEKTAKEYERKLKRNGKK